MTPTEKLQAAIDKLETLRAQSGTYEAWNGGDFQHAKWAGGHGRSEYEVGKVGTLTVTVWDGSEQDSLGDWRDSSAVVLIQTLHRTIDAQLAILRWAVDNTAYRPTERTVALADAILGADHV